MALLRATTALMVVIMATISYEAWAQQPPPAPFSPGPGQNRPPPRDDQGKRPPPPGHQGYSIEQAVSDNAQLHTIAFNGLAFITGSFGASTFIPPGKVSDFFGFQYMRDIDRTGKGHNPQFLDRVAGNVLSTLDDRQRALFAREAQDEANKMQALALQRFPMIAAFHHHLDGEPGLNPNTVSRYAGRLFQEDAALAYQRAAVFAQVAASLTAGQKAQLGRMRFGDFSTWPAIDMEPLKLPRGSSPMLNVAYMTLASEFFSWTAGSPDADTYFCPERHGTYFGGFFLKDMPAMGKHDFDISTALTGDLGETFMQTLDGTQRAMMMDLIERQRAPLMSIVETRRAISGELRKFLTGTAPDRDKVLALGQRYGQLDGQLAALYAQTFTKIAHSLTPTQRQTLTRLRGKAYPAAPAYLYAEAIASQSQYENLYQQFFNQ